MLSRRSFCCGLPTAAAFAATVIPTVASAAEDACAVYTADTQKAVTPDDAIAMLQAGNERFVSGTMVNCDLMAQVKATAGGQAPFACVVGCIDSRVPPELVFDQQLGDIFSARIAGNFVNTDIIGSMEFATKLAGAKAIVVLGHSACGAVKGAVDDAKLGNLTATLANIMPAVAATPLDGEKSSKNDAFVQKVADTNVLLTVQKLLSESQVLSDMVAAGELKVVGAMHDLSTGKVTFFS